MNTVVEKIIVYLNENKVRATYGAVADACGVNVRLVGAMLGERRPEASWVVAASNGEPTGYSPEQKHPDLHFSPLVIRSADVFHRELNL